MFIYQILFRSIFLDHYLLEYCLAPVCLKLYKENFSRKNDPLEYFFGVFFFLMFAFKFESCLKNFIVSFGLAAAGPIKVKLLISCKVTTLTPWPNG